MAGTWRNLACTKQPPSHRLPVPWRVSNNRPDLISLPSATELPVSLGCSMSYAITPLKDASVSLLNAAETDTQPTASGPHCLFAGLTRVTANCHALSLKRTCHHSCTCRNHCRFSCPPKGAYATPASVANRTATEQSQTNSADAAVVILAPSCLARTASPTMGGTVGSSGSYPYLWGYWSSAAGHAGQLRDASAAHGQSSTRQTINVNLPIS